MKTFISTAFYAYLNYICSILLLFSPWLFGFDQLKGGSASMFVPVIIGSSLLIMALFTNNELGVYKAFPMQLHLITTTFAGFFVLVSPWVFNFSSQVYIPHVCLGSFFLLAGIFTSNSPFLNKPHRALREAGIQSTDANEGRLMV